MHLGLTSLKILKETSLRFRLLALVVPVSGVTWVKSAGGASCEHTCAARDGCNEELWPKSLEEFQDVAQLAGVECVTTQEGGAKYDPSTDGRHCGWSGSEGNRCAEAGDSSMASGSRRSRLEVAPIAFAPATRTRSSESIEFELKRLIDRLRDEDKKAPVPTVPTRVPFH